MADEIVRQVNGLNIVGTDDLGFSVYDGNPDGDAELIGFVEPDGKGGLRAYTPEGQTGPGEPVADLEDGVNRLQQLRPGQS